jgi:hypothetical protein
MPGGAGRFRTWRRRRSLCAPSSTGERAAPATVGRHVPCKFEYVMSTTSPPRESMASLQERIDIDRLSIDARLDELSVRARRALRPVAAIADSSRLVWVGGSGLGLLGLLLSWRRRRRRERRQLARAVELPTRVRKGPRALGRVPWLPLLQLGVMAAVKVSRRRADEAARRARRPPQVRQVGGRG